MVDVNEWLHGQGIPRTYADNVVEFVKKKYPILSQALKSYKDVVGELELVALVKDVQTGKLPPTQS